MVGPLTAKCSSKGLSQVKMHVLEGEVCYSKRDTLCDNLMGLDHFGSSTFI